MEFHWNILAVLYTSCDIYLLFFSTIRGRIDQVQQVLELDQESAGLARYVTIHGNISRADKGGEGEGVGGLNKIFRAVKTLDEYIHFSLNILLKMV